MTVCHDHAVAELPSSAGRFGMWFSGSSGLRHCLASLHQRSNLWTGIWVLIWIPDTDSSCKEGDLWTFWTCNWSENVLHGRWKDRKCFVGNGHFKIPTFDFCGRKCTFWEGAARFTPRAVTCGAGRGAAHHRDVGTGELVWCCHNEGHCYLLAWLD